MQSTFPALKKPSPPRRHQRGQRSKSVVSQIHQLQSLGNNGTNDDVMASGKSSSDALVQPPFYLTPIIILPSSYPNQHVARVCVNWLSIVCILLLAMKCYSECYRVGGGSSDQASVSFLTRYFCLMSEDIDQVTSTWIMTWLLKSIGGIPMGVRLDMMYSTGWA